MDATSKKWTGRMLAGFTMILVGGLLLILLTTYINENGPATDQILCLIGALTGLGFVIAGGRLVKSADK